jgi:hypothetical protein
VISASSIMPARPRSATSRPPRDAHLAHAAAQQRGPDARGR